MVIRRSKDEKGFTLVELTIAMAMFTVVLGATAQALVSYYAALDYQNQRNTALRHCTGVMSQMREARSAATTFPHDVTTEWPDGKVVNGVATLKGEQVSVNYVNAIANPLEVTVRSQWLDIQGRSMSVSASTVLTDE